MSTTRVYGTRARCKLFRKIRAGLASPRTRAISLACRRGRFGNNQRNLRPRMEERENVAGIRMQFGIGMVFDECAYSTAECLDARGEHRGTISMRHVRICVIVSPLREIRGSWHGVSTCGWYKRVRRSLFDRANQRGLRAMCSPIPSTYVFQARIHAKR